MKEAGSKPGDVVVLKSGGPLMTVESISREDGDVYCVWFVLNRAKYALKHASFAPVALRRHKPDSGDGDG